MGADVAWVRSGSVHVIGAKHVGAYAVAATFAWTAGAGPGVGVTGSR